MVDRAEISVSPQLSQRRSALAATRAFDRAFTNLSTLLGLGKCVRKTVALLRKSRRKRRDPLLVLLD